MATADRRDVCEADNHVPMPQYVYCDCGLTRDERPRSDQCAALVRIAEQLVIEATAATNALACLARAQYQHAEVARLHTAIGLLKEQLVGYHGNPPVSEASGSTQSEAQKANVQVELARLKRARG